MQALNASSPILMTLFGIDTQVRPGHLQNASHPILVTLQGIVTLVRLVRVSNAPKPPVVFPIATTGRPPIVEGIVMSPPGPV
jgi:hypothetical protein